MKIHTFDDNLSAYELNVYFLVCSFLSINVCNTARRNSYFCLLFDGCLACLTTL